jgi:hypothetical protein
MKQSDRTLTIVRLVPAPRIMGPILGPLVCVMFGLMAGCSSNTNDGKGGNASQKKTGGGKKENRESAVVGKADEKYPAKDSKFTDSALAQESKSKQPKSDDKTKQVPPPIEITLTPDVKAVFTHVIEYGGRLFADGTRQDAPIVAVRAFGFGQDTKKLTALRSLEHLDLRGKLVTQKMSNFDPASLTQFKNLKTLALGPTSPQDLSHLAAIETLETVSFEVDFSGERPKEVTINDVLQDSLTEVAKVKHLKHLRIGNSGSSFGSKPSDFAAIPSCPNLTYLESWVICDDASLAHIGKSQSLKKLVIVFPKGVVGAKATFSAKGLAALAASKLSSVQLNDADDSLCEAMADLPNLKELIVGGSVSKSAIERVKAKHPDLRITSYREAFKPPFAEPRDKGKQVLPPNRWRQVMYSKKTSKYLLSPFESNNTENYFDGLK